MATAVVIHGRSDATIGNVTDFDYAREVPKSATSRVRRVITADHPADFSHPLKRITHLRASSSSDAIRRGVAIYSPAPCVGLAAGTHE